MSMPGLSAFFVESAILMSSLSTFFVFILLVFGSYLSNFFALAIIISDFFAAMPLHMCTIIFSLLCQCYFYIFKFLCCKSQPKVFMLSIELINLYNIMFALVNNIIMPFVTSSIPILSKLIVLITFTKHKNLVVKMPTLAINNYVTTNNIFTI